MLGERVLGNTIYNSGPGRRNVNEVHIRRSYKQLSPPGRFVPMRHHTKDKGDIGLGYVIANLLEHGVQVALPLSEHLPFDCIAVSKDGKLSRLSVKFRSAKKGVIDIPMHGSWADRHGSHKHLYDRTQFDATAIFCPETCNVYYIRNDEVLRKSIRFRVFEAKHGGYPCNGDNYLGPDRLFVKKRV